MNTGDNTKIAIIYGTRPEYLKVLPVIRAFRNGMGCVVIRVCQHNDLNEPDLQYDDALEIVDGGGCGGRGRLDDLGAQIMRSLYGKLEAHGVGAVLVQGDTATVYFSALVAFHHGLKIMHLEGGMRTYDLANPWPEEAYRQMISRITDVHFVAHQHNADMLKAERVKGAIMVVGNTILDQVVSYGFGPAERGRDVVITFHRRENKDCVGQFVKRLGDFIRANLEEIRKWGMRFRWLMHPNKELQRVIAGLVAAEEEDGCEGVISLEQPVDHKTFVGILTKEARCLLTDSGGIQEECAFIGKPCIVLRKVTERDQIPAPYLWLVPEPFEELGERLLYALTEVETPMPPCLVYGSGDSAVALRRHTHALLY